MVIAAIALGFGFGLLALSAGMYQRSLGQKDWMSRFQIILGIVAIVVSGIGYWIAVRV